MNDEIVRNLMKKKRSGMSNIKFSLLHESLREAEEDEELDMTPEGEEEEEIVDTPEGEEEEAPEEDTTEEEEAPAEEEEVEEKPENTNPLDNHYAVNYKIGDRVVFVHTSGAKSEITGVVEGYDKEGFYRIKCDDGTLFNGVTDILLSEKVSEDRRTRCVCGSTDFVQENGYMICDRCGRYIDEVAPVSESKNIKKRSFIRAEAHPMSTATRPNINEDYEEDAFAAVRQELQGSFWTRLPELVEDIEELGYDVLESNSEYVVIAPIDSDEEYYIPIGGTSRTMTLDFERARRAS